MLTAFALVIILGIGGMFSFFWLAASSFRSDNSEWSMMMSPWMVTRRLEEYYQKSDSWQGVQEEFVMLYWGDEWQGEVVLLDPTGFVVATNQPGVTVGAFFEPEMFGADVMISTEDMPLPESSRPGDRARQGEAMGFSTQTIPITVDEQQVGTLIYQIDYRSFANGFPEENRIGQGILSAGLGLAAILLGLAAFFSGRISTPLRRLTAASKALSEGKMQTRVPTHYVREINELSLAFNGMADALVQADEQRRQLTADVAHELRTPLSIIKGRLEGIQDGVYQPNNEQIDGLLDEVALLERLIEDLRLLALADAGQLPLYQEVFAPRELLEQVRHSFEPAAHERGVTLISNAAVDLPELRADPQRIAQVLGNLVGNALRYTPAGGTITLGVVREAASRKQEAGGKRQEVGLLSVSSASGETNLLAASEHGERPGSCLLFTVSDTGHGIPSEDLPRIFDRFYRADRSRTRSSGGAGLGLAIARRIIEAHGGTIWAESELGKGTTVRFRLPV
jgi:two-component system OmpR family sensor kinase/two-component system sensor histidine kinase BaeS